MKTKINVTTDRVEELWTELSQAWPAVKNNPEIAEKIEKLWNILKTSGNEHLQISKEIQSLLGNSNIASNMASNIKAADSTTEYLHSVSQVDDSIDDLLAEILGDDYKQEINHPASQIINEQNKTPSSDSSSTDELDKLVASILGEDWLKEESSSVSSTSLKNKQIAKTIQSTDTSESGDLIFNTDHNVDSIVSSIIADESSDGMIKPTPDENQADVQDIDKLLDEILNDDESTTSSKQSPSDNVYALNINKPAIEKPDENIDDLINDIINKDTGSENIISSLGSITNEEQIQTTELKPEENIDDLINDIINKDTDPDSETLISSFNSVTNEEQIQTTELKPEENIDDLINDIINKDTAPDSENIISSFNSITNEEQTPAAESKTEENIDDLINDIINKDIDSENAISNLSSITNEEQIITTGSKAEENVDDLINNILNGKTDTKAIEENTASKEETVVPGTMKNTAFQTASSQKSSKATPPPIVGTTKVSNSYKQVEKENNNTLILIIILIILILAGIGIWKVFFSNNESKTERTVVQNQYTESTSTFEKDIPVVEETYTPENIYKSKPEYTPNTYQYETETTPEYAPSTTEPDTSYVEPDSSVSSYYAPVEINENDITITLNTPETAIAENDSTIFNGNENIAAIEVTPLVEDNINTIEKITETTSPTETLGENELILKESTIEKTEIVKKENSVKAIARRKVITHVIVKGDTLWAIAKRYVNNPYRYPELARLSKIKNPDRIYPGKKVKIIIYIK